MAVHATVGFKVLLAGARVTADPGRAADCQTAQERDDLPDLAAIHGEAGHGCTGDAFGDDAEQPFVVGGMAEPARGEVRAASAALAIYAMATGALRTIESAAPGAIVWRLKRILERGVAVLRSERRGA